MAASAIQRRYTLEEYLSFEREAAYKSEYIDGQIIAMTGASRVRGLISMNLSRVLAAQLVDRPCEAFAGAMRVEVAARRAYVYPDFVVVCGEPRYEDAHLDTLLNPVLIVEILSPSTEAYDRGDKFGRYRELHSLHEYILISQNKVLVERFVREDDGWLLTTTHDLDSVMHLSSIGCELPLAEVYRKVGFSDACRNRAAS